MNTTNTNNPAIHVVYSAHQSALMKRVDALMWAILPRYRELGHEFSAMRWAGHGLSFQGACCWDIAQLLAEQPGAYVLHKEALELASALQKCGAEVFNFR